MSEKQTRRTFVHGTLAAAAGGALAMSLEEDTLFAQLAEGMKNGPEAPRPVKPGSKAKVPTGKLGTLEISRVILGGNLIGGWAHARDLTYVSQLLRHYFTPERILQTLQIAEEWGVNCVNTHPNAGELLQRYRKERGGTIRWIAQGFPETGGKGGMFDAIQRSIDQGADSVYIQGNVGDRLVEQKKFDVLARSVEHIRKQGFPAGIGGHALATMRECKKAGVGADYYVKTLHTNDYFSARRPDQTDNVIRNRNDNFWCADPEGTIRFMKTVKKPWIAFKVMAAGAIPPRKAFAHAFNHGADFILAGMFDFQIGKDALIAKDVLAKVRRERGWMA